MADYPLINGLKWDWSSAEISINAGAGGSQTFIGIKELSWTESLEPGIVRGTSAQKLARTRGEHDAEATMVMYTEDAMEFLSTLGDGYGEVSFDITCSWSGPGTPTKTARLEGARIVSKEGGGSQGTDPLEMSFDLDVLKVLEDGLSMVANSL